MLATHMQYSENPMQDGSVVMAGRTRAQHPMSKSEAQDILQIGKDAFYKFLDDMERARLVDESVQGGLILSNWLFAKGRLPRQKRYAAPTARLSVPKYQRLYTDNVKSAKEIGTILRLIPFIHKSEHVLCWNPYEENLNLIAPLTFTDVCRVLGRSTNNVDKYRKRFEKSMSSMAVRDGQSTHPLCTVDNYHEGRYAIFINAGLVYFKELMPICQ